jgi:hypothetical protein
MKRIFYLFLLFSISLSSLAQKGRVEGRVTDKDNKEPIPFANVQIVGTTTGAVTDIDGKFIITGLEPGYINLKITFVGYKPFITSEILVTNSNPVYQEFELETASKKLQEVVIVANPFDKRDDALVSVQRIGIKEIETNPGANRDISRVIQSFPGVATTPAFRNDIIVRGGGPSESRFFLDGVEIPTLNHFATQGAGGGPVGIINSDFIASVDYYAGSFPASRYNALSGVFEFRQKEGNNKKLNVQGAVGASEAAITFDGPLGEKANMIFSVRRSYLQFLFSALELPFLPTFTDYQLKTKVKINDKNEFTLVSIGALDQFALNEGIEDPDASQEYILTQIPTNNQWSYAIGGVWKHFTENGFHTFVLSRNMLDNSFYKYPDNDETQPRTFDFSSQEIENKARWEFSQKKNGISIRYGLSGEYAKYNNQTSQFVFLNDSSFFFNYTSDLNLFKFGGFAQASKRFLNEKLLVSLGVRADGSSFNAQMANPFNQLSPRTSFAYSLDANTKLNAGIGRYFQLPAYTTLGFRNEAGTLLNKDVEYIGANHFILGLERTFKDKALISVEGFYKDYFQYPINKFTGSSLANSGADYSSVSGASEVISTGKGRAVGAELLYRLRLKTFYIIAAYTYVRSSFTDSSDTFIPSSWDSRHLLTLTGSKEFKKNWVLGFKWRFSGGLPYTPFDLATSSNIQVWNATNQPVFDFTRLNSERFSPFHQLDLRVDKRFFFEKLTLMVYFDIQNAYNFKNTGQDFVIREKNEDGSFKTEDNGTRYVLTRVPNVSGTVLPTLGIMVKF